MLWLRNNHVIFSYVLLSDCYVTDPKTASSFHFMMYITFCLFDSLRPLNNLSVMRDGLPGLNQY